MLPQGTKRVFTFPWRSAARVRADIREEFQFHLDMRTAELVAEARSEAEAREQAQREFGDEAGGAWACARVDTRLERRLHVGTIVDDPLRDMALGVGSDFFRTLGMPLLAGRAISQADTVGAARVAVVNEAFAKKFNLGPNPVGRRLGRRGASVLDTEIVGLVRDAKYSDVKGEVPAVLYELYRQNTELTGMYFYMRTALPPQGLLMAVPDVVRAIDPRVPVRDLVTMPQQVREHTFLDRMVSVLSLAFALLATVMAAAGLYRVLSDTIAQRTKEIGLRMASPAP